MNLLLLTQEEAALAGRPVNQPRMDTDRHGLDGEKVGRWEKEKRSEGLGTECPRAKGRGSDTKGHEDNMTDAGGTRPYRRGESRQWKRD